MSSVECGAVRELEALLRAELGGHVTLLKQSVRPLTAPGDNYGSVMLAVDVTLLENNNEPRTLHLVAKTCPANDFLCQLFNIQHTFRKEAAFYRAVLPSLVRFEQAFAVQRSVADLFARCYGSRCSLGGDSGAVDADAALLLENLRVRGFETGDRLAGLDRPHVELVLRDLAKFHAVPIGMRTHQPRDFQSQVLALLPDVVVGGMDDSAVARVVAPFERILAAEGRCAACLPAVRASMRMCLRGPYRFNGRDAPFTTLAHTDFWVNNCMVRRDALGRPAASKMVDMQLLVYQSLVHDLLFFLWSSTEPAVLRAHLDHFLRLYHGALLEGLRELRVPLAPYAWPHFQQELQRAAPREIGHLLIMYKPILTVRGALTDMAQVNEDTLYDAGELAPDFPIRVTDTTLAFIERGWLSPDAHLCWPATDLA